MPYELHEIKVLRKRFGLTQSELASRAGVSQSLIAKIESQRIDPTYSNAQKIFAALDSLHTTHELKAEQVMQKHMITVNHDAGLLNTINLMKKHNISQVPVLKGRQIIGLISETSLLEAALEGKKHITVEEVMQDAPPIISKNATVLTIAGLLRFYPLVIVAEKDKYIGIVAKSDLLGKVYK